MGGPMLAGASQHQLAHSSDEPEIPDTLGAAGRAGGSSTSVTIIVTDMAAKLFLVWVPSSAFTVTE